MSRDFDVINLAFGESLPGSRSTIQFIPDTRTSAAEIQADVAQLKSEGKKVLLSIGGANTVVELNTEADNQSFINSGAGIVTQYGLNGIDIDFEGSSLSLNAGDLDFRNPTTPKVINLISALRTLKSRFGNDFILTIPPETFYVQPARCSDSMALLTHRALATACVPRQRGVRGRAGFATTLHRWNTSYRRHRSRRAVWRLHRSGCDDHRIRRRRTPSPYSLPSSERHGPKTMSTSKPWTREHS